jgi:site-specific DNA recombinase
LPRVAAIYTRVSSDQQARDGKTSLDTQELGCRQWAVANGYVVDEQYIYRDQHTGEELWERPQLTALREAAQARRFACVVAHSVDRLTRNSAHLLIVLDQFERAGVGLDFVTERLDNTPLGRMVVQLQGFAAEVENERKRERVMRATHAKALAGRPIPSNRPLYGYRWVDASKSRLEPDPQTAPIVQRIFREYTAGRTLRQIATDLTDQGIPTPTKRPRGWNPTSIRCILVHPTYHGAPVALRWQSVPVEKHLRAQYAKRTRKIRREEPVSLPSTIAPALVTPETAAEVERRLRLNQQLAVRNSHHPEAGLLRGALARCGYCGGGLYVNHLNARPRKDCAAMYPERWVYKCRNATRVRGQCSVHAVDTHCLDDAVWAAVCRVLRNPALIEQEVARMRETDDPGADGLAAIDRQIADLARRIKNKREYAELVDDPRERAEVAGEVSALRRQQDRLEAERVATLAHYADWRAQQEGLERVIDWCHLVGAHLDAATYQDKRNILLALRAEVKLYRADHTPRAELAIHLPLSGALPLDMDANDNDVNCDETRTRAPGNSRRALRA